MGVKGMNDSSRQAKEKSFNASSVLSSDDHSSPSQSLWPQRVQHNQSSFSPSHKALTVHFNFTCLMDPSMPHWSISLSPSEMNQGRPASLLIRSESGYAMLRIRQQWSQEEHNHHSFE